MAAGSILIFFQSVLDAGPSQRAGVGQGDQHQSAHVVAVGREEVLRAVAVARLEFVEKPLARLIAFVVLVESDPAG